MNLPPIPILWSVYGIAAGLRNTGQNSSHKSVGYSTAVRMANTFEGLLVVV